MEILSQFLLRLAFGLCLGMAVIASRDVSSGYFRNNLYVSLGLCTFAALVSGGVGDSATWFAILAAVLSYAGAACWLYESKRLGTLFLWLIALASFISATAGMQAATQSNAHAAAFVTSGLVLGFVVAAMLLGHWYLNEPGMELAPLRLLIVAAAIAVVVQSVVSGIGLAAELQSGVELSTNFFLFLVLRWSFGLAGVLGLLWMAWRTLEIPNTQSATGILYVAVIGVFVGELAAALLSARSEFPL